MQEEINLIRGKVNFTVTRGPSPCTAGSSSLRRRYIIERKTISACARQENLCKTEMRSQTNRVHKGTMEDKFCFKKSSRQPISSICRRLCMSGWGSRRRGYCGGGFLERCGKVLGPGGR